MELYNWDIIKSLESIQYTFQSEAIMNHEDGIILPSLVKNKLRTLQKFEIEFS